MMPSNSIITLHPITLSSIKNATIFCPLLDSTPSGDSTIALETYLIDKPPMTFVETVEDGYAVETQNHAPKLREMGLGKVIYLWDSVCI